MSQLKAITWIGKKKRTTDSLINFCMFIPTTIFINENEYDQSLFINMNELHRIVTLSDANAITKSTKQNKIIANLDFRGIPFFYHPRILQI